AQVIDVEPAGGARPRERWVEGVAEAEGREQGVAVGVAHRVQRGDRDLRRERDRAPRGGGGDSAVVRVLGEGRTARPVAVELTAAAVDRERQVTRSIRGGESPDAIAVAAPGPWVGVRVGTLGVGGPARVLEVVD